MNCHECAQQLDEFAVAVDQGSFQEVQRHLASCPECQARLLEITDAWSQLSFLEDDPPVPSNLTKQVMTRVEQAKQTPKRPVEGGTPAYWRYVVAASVLLLGTTGIYILRYRTPQIAAAKRFDQQLLRLEEIQNKFGDPEVFYVSLQDSNQRRTAAVVVYDAITNQLHFYAFDLRKPPDRSAYKLWVYTEEQLIRDVELQWNDKAVASAVAPLNTQLQRVETRVTLEYDRSNSTPTGHEYLRSTIILSKK